MGEKADVYVRDRRPKSNIKEASLLELTPTNWYCQLKVAEVTAQPMEVTVASVNGPEMVVVHEEQHIEAGLYICYFIINTYIM